MGDVVIRELGRSDRDAFVDVVAPAFARDPLFTDVLGRVDHQRALIRHLFGATRVLGGNRMGLFVDGRPAGAALLEPPRGVGGSLRMAPTAATFLPLAIRLPLATTSALNTYMRIARAAAPAAPHHYLTMIGVAAAHRGAGHGQRLVEEVMERAQQHPRSTGVALDTENEHNVAMYTNWGFRLTGVYEMSTVRIHTMAWATSAG